MAEEITYIPYGQNEISQLNLMTNLANGLPSFMQHYKWLLKPKNKEKFLKAYDDITKNLTGATDSSGRWIINVNNIDIDGMSSKDKEIYEHAAYYIQLQMSLMTPRAKEEEKKKEDLVPFKFITDFNKYLLRGYGNSKEIFVDPELGWNAQDARGSNGLRGTEKRRAAMIKALQEYSDSLEDNKYNFEGTQFTDLADAKAKIQKAISALRDTPNDESDDLPAFSALGLPYRSYFSNGGNEYTTNINEKTGNLYTYNEWNEYQLLLAKDKTKLETEKLKAQQANYWKGFRTRDLSKFNGRPLTALESNVNYLNLLFAKPNLSGDEASQIVSAFKLAEKNGLLVPLSKEEIAKLNPNIWKNRTLHLRKIKDISTPLYYDTLNKLFKYFYNLNSPQISFLDILDLNNPSKIAELQLLANLKAMNAQINWSDIDEATSNELWAVANDIGAFVDPEAITGTIMALNAARLRDKNRGEGWNWERILDWGTSALGGLPIIGDAMSAYKAGSNLVKIANASARIGSLVAAAFSVANVPEAWDSIKKIVSKGPTSMTTLDIRNITYGLMGFAAGWKTINSVNARPKPQTTKEKSIEIDGKKVVLDEPTIQKIETAHKLSKNTKEASDNIVKMKEVRDAAKKAGIEVTDASKVTSGSGVLRGNRYSKSLGLSKSPIQTNTVETGNITPNSSNRYWMPRTRRNFLDEYSNTLETPKNPLRKGLDWFMGRTPETKILDSLKSSSEVSQKPQETPKIDSKKVGEYKAEIENFKKSYGYTDTPSPVTGGYGQSGSTLEAGKFTINIGGEKITFKLSKSELKDILKNGKINEGKVSEIRGRFAKQVNELSSKKDVDVKEIAKALKKLKAKGWLKQGGQINSLDKIIEDFIKNNNI